MRRISSARRSRIGRILSLSSGASMGTTRAPHVAIAGEFALILRRIKEGDREGFQVTPGITRHLPVLPHRLGPLRIALNRLSNTVPVVLHFIRFQPPPTPNRKRWFDT